MELSQRSKKGGAAVALACAIATPCEGLREYAYKDPVGIPTICFGSTKGVKMGDVKTVEQCKAMLTIEMAEAVNLVDRCHPDLPPNVLAAFGDAAYNLGPTIACDTKNSTAARYLATHNYSMACAELSKWNKARMAGILVELPGLTKRRQMERELCEATT